jgi:hypothetical protein
MSASVPTLLTVGEIARRLKQPLHRIEYVLRAREIQPTGRAGNSHVYSEEQVAQIEAELRSIRDKKGEK